MPLLARVEDVVAAAEAAVLLAADLGEALDAANLKDAAAVARKEPERYLHCSFSILLISFRC